MRFTRRGTSSPACIAGVHLEELVSRETCFGRTLPPPQGGGNGDNLIKLTTAKEEIKSLEILL